MDKGASLLIGLICTWLVWVLIVLLSGLERPWNLGGKIMSVIDEAIARFTAFTQGVLDQLKGAKTDNDLQTAKLAELQAALDKALADDNADKATIASLQADVSSLQDKVAAQINAAVDALANPPAEVPPVTTDPGVPADPTK
jgi:hypothetical protein